MASIAVAIRYASNLAELKNNLQQSVDQIEVTTAAAKKMTDALGGAKQAQAVNNFIAGVQGIGGVSKLTADQQEKLHTQVSKAIEKYEVMGKTVPTAWRDIQAATLPAVEAANKAADATENAATQTEGFSARVTGLVAAAAAAREAIHETVAIVGEWIHAFSEQEDATVRLDTALRAQGSFTPKLSQQYQELATQFENTTVFSDELVQGMEALLIQVGDVGPKDMKAALTAATDLAAGLRIDLHTATMLVGKAFAGETGTLKRYGIVIDEAKLKTEGAAAVIQAISEKMGGQASAQAQTFSGHMAQLGNQVNNVKESIGGAIVSALQPLFNLMGALPEPLRTAAIAVTLIGGALVAATIAIGGLGAAVSIALPLIGVALPAGAGVATIAMTALTAATSALWAVLAAPITIAVAAAAVAFIALKGTLDEGTKSLRDNIQAMDDHQKIHVLWNQTTPLTIEQQQEFADAVNRQSNQIKGIKAPMVEFSSGLKIITDDTVDVVARTKEYTKALGELKDKLSGTNTAGQIALMATAVKDLGGASAVAKGELPGMVKQIREWIAAGYDVPPLLRSLAASSGIATDAQNAYNKAIRDGAAELTGKKLASEVQKLADQLAAAGGMSHLTAFEFKKTAEEAAKFQEQGAKLTGELAILAASHAKVAQTIDMTGRGWEEARMWATNYGDTIDAVAMQTLRDIIASTAGQAHALDLTSDHWADLSAFIHEKGVQIKGDADRMAAAQQDAAKKFSASIDKLMQSLTQLATIAGDSFGGWVKGAAAAIAQSRALVDAIKAGKDALNAFKSGAISAGSIALGVFGFIGSKLLGMFAETKAQIAQAKADWKRWQDEAAAKNAKDLADGITLLDQFADSWKNLTAVGRDNRINAAVVEIVGNLYRLQLAGATGEGAIRAVSDSVNDLLIKIATSGGSIGPGLMPVVEQMVNLGLVSEEAMRKLMGLASPQTVDWKAMSEAAQKYGIDISDLGPKFQQARLDELFKGLLTDFNLLRDGGANMAVVIEKMGPQVNDAVTQALKFGATIPAAMKPMLEAMVKAGELTDLNGNKLTDLSQLKFAVPIEDSLQELVKLFKDFIEQIKKSTDYINKIPREIPVDIIYKDNRGGGGGASAASDAADSVSSAHGGALVMANRIQRFHRGVSNVLPFPGLASDEVPAVLQTGEAVLRREAVAALGADAVRALNGLGRGSNSLTSASGSDPTHREIKGLREDLARQRSEHSADMATMRTLLPKAVASAVKKAVA